VASIGGTAVYALGLPAASRGGDTAPAVPSPLRQARLRVLLACVACYGIARRHPQPGAGGFRRRARGTSWAGILVAIWGVGSLVGGLAYGSRDWRSPVEDRAMVCLALFAAILLLLAAAPGLAVLALLMIPLGIPLSLG
jgi:hypothetical protein